MCLILSWPKVTSFSKLHTHTHKQKLAQYPETNKCYRFLYRFQSTTMSGSVCSLLQNGSIALVGPLRGRRVYFHVQSISDSLEIPHIQFDWLNSWISPFGHSSRNQLSINLYPNGNRLSLAYIDLVKAWQWKSFVILYEANEGMF